MSTGRPEYAVCRKFDSKTVWICRLEQAIEWRDEDPNNKTIEKLGGHYAKQEI